MWLVLRDVPFGDVARIIARANWWVLLGVSIPSYLLAVYLRALRWRHLTDPIQSIGISPLFRAVSVGFMANNLIPLRVGEVVRSWYLARETGGSVSAIFGTVVLERVLDIVSVVLMAAAVIAFWGGESQRVFAGSALILVAAALAPILALVALRVAPDRLVDWASRLLRPFSTRLSDFVVRLLRGVSAGLGALKGGRHLLWIALHSVGIWLVASTLPILAGMWALGVDFGSPGRELMAAWITLAAIGVAVARPSAPGFFGAYHFACKFALERFGVPADTAVALGTLTHAVFWVTLTVLGLGVLRVRRTSLTEIDEATGGP